MKDIFERNQPSRSLFSPSFWRSEEADATSCTVYVKYTEHESRLFIAQVVNFSLFRTSNQARVPAEFKHITKRRKRN